MVEHALEYGVILRPLGDVISFCPPLIIDRAETDFLFDAVTRALDRVLVDLGGKRRRKVVRRDSRMAGRGGPRGRQVGRA